jgi:hypothetical protein
MSFLQAVLRAGCEAVYASFKGMMRDLQPYVQLRRESRKAQVAAAATSH